MMNSVLARCATVIAIIYVSATLSVSAADPVASARGVYDTSMMKISTSHAQKLRTYPARYVKALGAAQAALQRAGDLAGHQAVGKELTRYRSEGTIKPEHLSASSAELRAVQDEYLKVRNAYNREKAQAVLGLHQKYVAHLEGLQTTLTKSGNISGALAARDEITRVNESAIVSGATEIASVAKAEAAVSEEPVSEAPAAGTVERDGVKIYQGGARPPMTSDVVYKSQSLSRSGRAPLSGGVSVRTWLGSIKDTDQTRSSSSYSSSTSRSTSEQRFVRLAVRSSSVSLVRDNVTVVVQYFSKSIATSTSQSRGTPVQMSMQKVKIDRLDSDYVYLEFPSVSLSSSSYRYSSSYSSGRGSRSGSKFYGYGVTVFDADGALIFQGASVRVLDPQLVTAVPEDPPSSSSYRRFRERRMDGDARDQ